MDVLSLFSGSDNLYKHLFIGGLGMIILSLFYPLEKEFQLSTQKDNYNKEIRLLNTDIEKLKKAVSIIELVTPYYFNEDLYLITWRWRQGKFKEE